MEHFERTSLSVELSSPLHYTAKQSLFTLKIRITWDTNDPETRSAERMDFLSPVPLSVFTLAPDFSVLDGAVRTPDQFTQNY